MKGEDMNDATRKALEMRKQKMEVIREAIAIIEDFYGLMEMGEIQHDRHNDAIRAVSFLYETSGRILDHG